MNRAPSVAPDLPGYAYIEHIGAGGFADVFLYEQQALGRRVAVKVLLASEATSSVQEQFAAESTLMAALSTHPHIVSIYDASISADRRPYLIMEYCSRKNLDERYKSEKMSVADVVTIGIQLGGAVETAHRAGILHRDIKPANVLTTDYNRPALTDFGISVVTGSAQDSDTVGMSIPWSPPEMLTANPDGDQRADVYSLSATLYTLLAGRSPYRRPGGPNSAADLINRIQRSELPRIGRSDVPDSLEQVLSRGLAKNPAARWTSALQFARALQDVQAEQSWPMSQVDVFADNPQAAQREMTAEDDGRTRIRGLTTIHAQDASEATGLRGSGGFAASAPAVTPGGANPGGRPQTSQTPDSSASIPAVERTQLRSTGDLGHLHASRLASPEPADTMMRAAVPTAAAPDMTEPRRKRWPWLVAASVAVLVGLGAITAVLLGGTAPATLPSSDRTSAHTTDQEAAVPEPVDLSVTVTDGTATFTWANPDSRPGDSYQWQRTDAGADASAHSVTEPTSVVDDASACIQVLLIRDNGQFSQPVDLCAESG